VIRQFRASLFSLVFGIVVLGFSRTTADPDLWGHLRFGLDLLDIGHVIRPDPYSFLTNGGTWVNHEWLAEALLAIAWRAAGAPGIILLKLGITLAIVGVLYACLLRRGLTVFGASTVLLVNIPLTLPWLGAARPQMFTYLCFAITLVAIVLAEYDETGGRRASGARAGATSKASKLWVLTPTFLLWANLHGGFLAGIGIVGIWTAARAVQTAVLHGPRATEAWRCEACAVWLPVTIAVLATLVTPYAGDLWLFLRTALTSRLEIVEWNPIEAMSVEGLAHIVVLVPAICGWFWSRRERRPSLLVLFMVTSLLPFIARRHTPLFAIGLIVLAGEHEADVMARLFERQAAAGENRPADSRAPDSRADDPRPAAPRVIRLFAAMFLAIAAVCVFASVRHFGRIVVDREEYPIEAVQMLRASGLRGNVATNFNWGEYVLWHLGPAVKVSIDGRRETVYSDAVYEENQRFAFGHGKWDTLIERPDVDLALVPTQHWPVSNLLRLKPGWSPAYEDDRSAIFVRQGSTAAAVLLRAQRPLRAPDDVAFP
jgi:hypothetical protein